MAELKVCSYGGGTPTSVGNQDEWGAGGSRIASRRVRASRPLLAVALLGLTVAACGGGGEDRSAGIIHRLLLAAGASEAGTLESFVGRLPDGLPAEPPLYPGAEVVVSSRQPAPVGGLDAPEGAGEVPSPLLYFIVLDTADGRGEVFAFYEEALDGDPWQIESAFSTEDLDTIQFVKVDDPDIAGAVSIARGGEDGRTSILISLQDAGAFVEEEPAFELGESLPLPKEFPPDVPLYPDATVTSTAFFREPGNRSFLLVFLTRDGQDQVVEFYQGEFERLGWTATEGAPIGLEERIDFRDARGDIEGEVRADRFARDRSLTEVRLRIQLDPAREPSDAGDATPTEEEGARRP